MAFPLERFILVLLRVLGNLIMDCPVIRCHGLGFQLASKYKKLIFQFVNNSGILVGNYFTVYQFQVEKKSILSWKYRGSEQMMMMMSERNASEQRESDI